MEESVILYKYAPLIVKGISVLLAIIAGFLVYSGLSNQIEKQHLRLRFKENLKAKQTKFKQQAETSKVEQLFKEAGYPLGINGLKWQFLKWGIFFFVIMNYIIFPLLTTGNFHSIIVIVILAGMLFFAPEFPYSITRFILKRLIEYKQAKRNSELFSLYDMLLSEIQMMQQTRINAYSLLRSLKPYFKELDGAFSRLLTNWTSSEGPEYALDQFAKEIGTAEAKSLAYVLKTFDENNRETLIQSLMGMEDMFITSQIENYRRKRKLHVDLGSLPIKAAHFLIILNFVLVIISMVYALLSDARL